MRFFLPDLIVNKIWGKSVPEPTSGDDGKAIVYDSDTSSFVLETAGAPAYSSAAEIIAGAEAAKVIAPDQLAAAGVRPIIKGTTVATTSGTAIDFTDIPAWVKRVTVLLEDVSTNSAGTLVHLQLGTSSGVETSGYVGKSNVTTHTGGILCTDDGAAANTRSGQIIIALMDSSTNKWVASGILYDANNTTLFYTFSQKSLGGVLDRIRLSTPAGTATFDAGSISIMYE